MPTDPDVTELRLVVTAEDYHAALAFYRDALGLPQLETYTHEGGHVTILDAGRATLELNDPVYAAHIDDVEVGRRVAGHIRVAFAVHDSAATTERLVDAGAELLALPTRTPGTRSMRGSGHRRAAADVVHRPLTRPLQPRSSRAQRPKSP